MSTTATTANSTETATTGDFFQATILSTAKGIARDYLAGNEKAASNRLEMHLGELTDADAALFIGMVKQFIDAKAS